MKLSELICEADPFSIDAYHGTGADIIAFRPKNLTGRGQHLLDIGIHVTENPALASDYARLTGEEFITAPRFLRGMSAHAKNGMPVVYPLKVNIGRVLDLTGRSAPDDIKTAFTQAYSEIASRQTVKRYTDMLNYDPVWALTHYQLKAGRRALAKLIKGLGYDSIRYNFGTEGSGPAINYVIFDPRRIRSRFAKFDPDKATGDLLEMPVRGFQKIGTFDQPRSMTRTDDLVLMRHPKHEAKVRRLFTKASMPIDMVFLNADNLQVPTQAEISASHFQQLTGLAHPAADAITMLYTFSQDRVGGGLPLSGWILAHKIGECATTAFMDFEDNAWWTFVVKTKDLLQPKYGASPTGKLPGSYISLQRFFNLVLTMKSARDLRLFNVTEALAECVAQYLVTSTVTFRSTGVERFDIAAEHLRLEMITAIQNGLAQMRGKAFAN